MKNFEEQFPSIHCRYNTVDKKVIMKKCLDKQRVRAAINKFYNEWLNGDTNSGSFECLLKEVE